MEVRPTQCKIVTKTNITAVRIVILCFRQRVLCKSSNKLNNGQRRLSRPVRNRPINNQLTVEPKYLSVDYIL